MPPDTGRVHWLGKIFSGRTSRDAETAPPSKPAARSECRPQNNWERTLHHFDGPIIVAGIDVELRGLCWSPVPTVGAGGRLQFAHGKINQASVAEQLGFLQVEIVGRRFRQGPFVAMLERRNVIERSE